MRVLYFDLDGSLLDHHENITERNLKAITEFMALGGKVGLATGRSYIESKRYIDMIKPNMPCFLLNGNQIYVDKKIIPYTKFPNAIYSNFCNLYEDELYFVEEFGNYYVSETIIGKKMFISAFKPELRQFTNRSDDELSCVYFMSKQGLHANEILKKFSLKNDENTCNWLSNFYIIKMNNYWIKAFNKVADKEICLEYIGKHNLIKENEIVFFANDYNDINMFKRVGVKVALTGSIEPILQIADMCIDNYEIANIIKGEMRKE
ncbi:MAG: Cof-type HAD-IIB family hydrolase [Defluviitaleaceae bacterium]|nr:Cof-type HAD-IIB family hydrolase [Defluviitaleaceae bacterium]